MGWALNMENKNKISRNKVALVTGSATGIGCEIAVYSARAGFRTYATMRNIQKAKEIKGTADAERLPKNTMFLKYIHAVSQLT
jgi:NAD(P)-dependent dehydrogenase (short-subunit alcohol dehydrogenase family)